MTDRKETDPRDEESRLADIFRHATPRPRPRGEARARAFEFLHQDWQRELQTRRRQRQWWLAGAAASILLAVFAGVQWLGGEIDDGMTVAVDIARSSGEVLINGERHDGNQLASRPLRPGDSVQTLANSRLALDWDGASLRIDQHTTIRLARGGRLQLDDGALYFDSRPFNATKDSMAALLVETPLGELRHIGTQYLAEMRNGRLGVDVREGAVRIAAERVDVAVQAGESAQLFVDGRFDRRPLAAHDARWQWAAEIAPAADLAGRTAAEVLDWIARELGREVRYASEAARQRAGHEPKGIAALAPLPALRTLPYMTSLSTVVTERYIVVEVDGDNDRP